MNKLFFQSLFLLSLPFSPSFAETKDKCIEKCHKNNKDCMSPLTVMNRSVDTQWVLRNARPDLSKEIQASKIGLQARWNVQSSSKEISIESQDFTKQLKMSNDDLVKRCNEQFEKEKKRCEGLS